MAQQIDVADTATGIDVESGGLHQVADDLAYKRLAIVNVVFVGSPGASDRGWVLIDAGVIGAKGSIIAAAAERFGTGVRPSAIVMTHGHFDHVGALESLAEEWDAPVYAHELEIPYLNGSASYPPGDPTVGGGLMALLSPLYPTKPVDVESRLRRLPVDGSVPPLPGWRWVHTPGHSPGHVSLWREADRLLVAGDAVVTTAQESAYAVAVQEPELHGPPRYFTPDWAAAKASVVTLAALLPDILVTGHGQAMSGSEMRGALEELALAFDQVAVPKHGRYKDHPARADDGTAYRKP